MITTENLVMNFRVLNVLKKASGGNEIVYSPAYVFRSSAGAIGPPGVLLLLRI